MASVLLSSISGGAPSSSINLIQRGTIANTSLPAGSSKDFTISSVDTAKSTLNVTFLGLASDGQIDKITATLLNSTTVRVASVDISNRGLSFSWEVIEYV